METLEDTLDRISRTGAAAFAMDGANRITYWNKACEGLLGQPARHVLGRHCYEVMCGRDASDNLYCHTSCPVAHQARQKDDPVHPFHVRALAGDGRRKEVEVSMFAVPSYHPALTAVVHVLTPVPIALRGRHPGRRPRSRDAAGAGPDVGSRGADFARAPDPALSRARPDHARHREGADDRARHRPQSHPEHPAEARRAFEAGSGRSRARARDRVAPSIFGGPPAPRPEPASGL